MAFQYFQQQGEPERRSFVCLRDAYHGDTIGAVSVGGIDLFHECYGPLLFDAHHVTPGDASELECILDFHDGEIAAVIVEPLVQGAAGIRVQPPGFLRRVRELCDRHDVLLICDEVATGLRPHRHDVRLRAGAGRAGPHVRGEGADRRLHAAGGDAGHRADLRGLPGRARGLPHLLSRPHLHGQPARLRGRDRQPRRVRERGHAGSAPAEDPPAGRAPGRRRRRCPRSPRCAAAASWSASISASTIRRSASGIA